MSDISTAARTHRRTSGFSLIELMVALVLGALMVVASLGIFASNRQAYRATESVSRVQENARAAFELLSQDLRHAGGNACARGIPVANVLTNAGGAWWSDWERALVGHESASYAAAETDSIDILSAAERSATAYSDDASGDIVLNANLGGIVAGDIVVACDYTQAAIFQANSVDGLRIGKRQAGLNRTAGLGLPVLDTAQGTPKSFHANSQVARLDAARWYVADNGRGGRSLFRRRMDKGTVLDSEEVAEGVRDLQLSYLQGGEYRKAGRVTDWAEVNAVRVEMHFADSARVGASGEVVQGRFVNTVSIRNRLS